MFLFAFFDVKAYDTRSFPNVFMQQGVKGWVLRSRLRYALGINVDTALNEHL